MNLQSFFNQLAVSQNPLQMAMGALPNQNLKSMFSSVANGKDKEEKAQILANICNRNGITLQQLQSAYKKRF